MPDSPEKPANPDLDFLCAGECIRTRYKPLQYENKSVRYTRYFTGSCGAAEVGALNYTGDVVEKHEGWGLFLFSFPEENNLPKLDPNLAYMLLDSSESLMLLTWEDK